MKTAKDQFNNEVGPLVDNWSVPQRPKLASFEGAYTRIEPINAEVHGPSLFKAFSVDKGGMWSYLPYGPFDSESDFYRHLDGMAKASDPLMYAIIDKSIGKATGMAAFLRILPPFGNIEVGHLAFSPQLQKTRVATEAMYLMMKHAFDLGYRRYEWKCNNLNEPSKKAALRYGFSFEGVFRNHIIVKNRSRDTAWYSIIDTEWPKIRAAFEKWLAPENFDKGGQQIKTLASFR